MKVYIFGYSHTQQKPADVKGFTVPMLPSGIFDTPEKAEEAGRSDRDIASHRGAFTMGKRIHVAVLRGDIGEKDHDGYYPISNLEIITNAKIT